MPGMIILTLLVGALIGYGIYNILNQKKIKLLDEKIFEADGKLQEIIETSEKKYQDAIFRAEKDINSKMKFLEIQQDKLSKKEDKIEEKENLLDKLKSKLEIDQKFLEQKISAQEEKLIAMSGMTESQAKEEIFSKVEKKYSTQYSKFIDKIKSDMEENAKFEATKLLSTTLPRITSEYTGEYTSSLVDLPSEDTKGRIIGREGRNIAIFEKLTGVEIVIDDTPLVVKLSSYDSEKRFLAVETLKRLIKDGRINPFYIEKTYNDVLASQQELVMEKGKEALAILGIPKFSPELTNLIGRFYFRYSYGQNLWSHSIEVAKLSGLIASELGLDPLMAKKAGLLHDIGKIAENSSEGHAKIGADMLRGFGLDEIIVNTAEGHHYDVALIHPIGWIVTAADAVSASRPGARYDTRELYIERMQALEQLVKGVEGIEKAYIMQAGREIMAFVDPQKVDDLQLQNIVLEVADKIEQQMEYPGMIRVVGVRESNAISIVK